MGGNGDITVGKCGGRGGTDRDDRHGGFGGDPGAFVGQSCGAAGGEDRREDKGWDPEQGSGLDGQGMEVLDIDDQRLGFYSSVFKLLGDISSGFATVEVEHRARQALLPNQGEQCLGVAIG